LALAVIATMGIAGRVDGQAGIAQVAACDLLVELIVLHDQHRFEIFDRKHENVLYILEWSGGLAARDKLRACVKAK